MSKLLDLHAWDVVQQIKLQDLKAEEYITTILDKIEETDKNIHAYITVSGEQALDKAKEIDNKIRRGESVGRLAGLALAVKDNICTARIRTTCSSGMLENYIPPYDAMVIERIKEEDAIIVGKTNMDEFAMGSTTEFSAFGPTKNPINQNYVPGGSSGGSAAAVGSKEATLALGSDTGGSIRCPAAFCSVVGLKPTYGLVSRFGLISYANSLEQIGPLTKDTRDCALLLSCIAKHDIRDATSINKPPEDYVKYLSKKNHKMKIGIIKEMFGEGTQEGVDRMVWSAIDRFKEVGALCEVFSLKQLDISLATYYIVAMAEASSNLARFDGMRYGLRTSSAQGDWDSTFSRNRRYGFGFEVKRRIILGTYALSAGYYEEYYLKAQKIRTIIRKRFERAFKKFDLLASPTMPVLPFLLGEKIHDPLEMYMCDIDTVPANLTGVPAISIPCGFYNGLPVGLQLTSPYFREDILLQASYAFENLRSKHI